MRARSFASVASLSRAWFMKSNGDSGDGSEDGDENGSGDESEANSTGRSCARLRLPRRCS